VFAGGQKEAGERGPQVLKISHSMPGNQPLNIMLVEMAKRINEKSGGSLEVQVYPNAEIGDDSSNPEQIKRGANIIHLGGTGTFQDYLPEYGITNGPYFFEDPLDILLLAKTPWAQEMNRQLRDDHNFQVLNFNTYYGGRYFISNKEIRTPDDLTNIKVRSANAKTYAATLKAMGAKVTILSWAEVYSALSQNVVDAAENTLATFYSSKLFETRNRVAKTLHIDIVLGLYMNAKLFDTLTPEEQELLITEAENFGVEATHMVIQEDEKYRKLLENEGVIFNDVDRAAFTAATKSVYNEFPEWTPGLSDLIQQQIRDLK